MTPLHMAAVAGHRDSELITVTYCGWYRRGDGHTPIAKEANLFLILFIFVL